MTDLDTTEKRDSSPSSASSDLEASHGITEKHLLRKLDRHLLPGVCILYLLSFLDRSNVANAKLDGLTTSLGISGNEYLTGLTLFFVGYIIFEVIWNVILKRFGPLSMWYKRSERQYRIALLFSAASLAGAFGGILAYGIGFMKVVGGYEGWRWIFIIEGLLTCVLAGPSIIKALGYTAAHAQLLTIPPYAFATILTVVYAVVSERYARRGPFIIASTLTAIIGYCILLGNTNPLKRPGVSYLGTFFAARGIYPSIALALSWPAINVSGQTKRATANAMQITIGNLGAVIGTQLYRANDGPRYIVGHSVALACLIGNIADVGTIWFGLQRENSKRDREEREGRVQTEGEWLGDEDSRWRFRL
ncbi:hypothetical protein LTR95_007004 [Oleoguttula sp. CCFEE 5521]